MKEACSDIGEEPEMSAENQLPNILSGEGLETNEANKRVLKESWQFEPIFSSIGDLTSSKTTSENMEGYSLQDNRRIKSDCVDRTVESSANSNGDVQVKEDPDAAFTSEILMESVIKTESDMIDQYLLEFETDASEDKTGIINAEPETILTTMTEFRKNLVEDVPVRFSKRNADKPKLPYALIHSGLSTVKGSRSSVLAKRPSYATVQVKKEETSECGESEDRKDALEVRRRKWRYGCSYCGKPFPTPAALARHVRVHTNERPFVCSLCPSAFRQKGDLSMHVRSVHTKDKPHQCEECGNRYLTRLILLEHKRAVHSRLRPYACARCPATFGFQTSLKLHMSTHDSVRRFVCDTCGDTFRRKDSLKSHVSSVHLRLRPYACAVCRRAFADAGAVRAHERTHTGEKPFACATCGDRFATNAQLASHALTHTRVKRFECAQCGKTFSHKVSLIAHMRVHTGEKPFECSACGKRFAQTGGLVAHTRTHTGERPFACGDCGVAYKRASDLHNHRQSAHAEGEPEFQCEHCGKRFGVKTSLAKHMRTHTGERPYVCALCGDAFALDSGLRVHALRRHSGGAKPHACDVCGRAFSYKGDLTKHEMLHAKDLAFKCSHCDKGFYRKEHLKSHLSMHKRMDGWGGDEV